MKFQKSYLCILLCWSMLGYTSCRSPQKNVSHPDDILVQAVLDAYKDSINQNPSATIDTLIKVQSRLTDSLSFYKISNQIVKAYYYANSIDSTFSINQRVIDYVESHPDLPGTREIAIDAYNSRGVFLNEYNLRDSAASCYLKAYGLMKGSERERDLPNICINLADVYHLNGNFVLASYYYRRALTISDSLKMGEEYNMPIFSGIARLYQELENYDLAESYYNEANKLLDGRSDYEKFFFYNSYGNYQYTIKAYDKALESFRKAKRLADKVSLQYFHALASGNIGEIFIWKEQPDSARYYLNLATTFFGDFSNQPSLEFYMNGLYASLALLENNMSEAERILMKSYDASVIQPQYQYYHHKRLYEFYLRKQDFKKAYQYFAQTTAYDDSLRSIKTLNNIAEIDSRYRQDTILIRKDMQIALTESRATQWRNIASFSILSLVLFAALVTGMILYRRKSRELKYQKQVATITGLRMEIVRNRLSPHFVFNALNTIMPTLENYRELQQPFRLLIQLLRNNLQASEQIAIPLENEIALVKDYLKLQALGQNTTIDINWDIEKGVPMETFVPSMSIQIPVENAIKYAFVSQSVTPYIQIHIAHDDKFLKITIEDNGVGYTNASPMNDKRGTGNGLKMLYRTIEILNTKNEEKMSFSIENLQDKQTWEKGTRVTLIIPFHYTFEL